MLASGNAGVDLADPLAVDEEATVAARGTGLEVAPLEDAVGGGAG